MGLAKCWIRNDEEFVKVVNKNCDHCLTEGLRWKAGMLKLSMENCVSVMDMVVLAEKSPYLVKTWLKLIPDTSHAKVNSEEISLHLFDCGNVNGSIVMRQMKKLR